MSDDRVDNVIEFPRNNRRKKLILTQESVFDIILALGSLNKSSSFNEECAINVDNNFPCKQNCGCYTYMISSMALEIVFDGERAKDASKAINNEYRLLMEKDENEL